MRERRLCCICCLLLLWFALSGIYRGKTEETSVFPVPESEDLIVSGTVYRQEYKKTNQRIYLKDISISSQAAVSAQKTSEEKKRIIVYLREEQQVDIGNHVLVSGICFYPQEQRNPGGFDAKSYYADMETGMFLKKAVILQKDDRIYPVRNAVSRFRIAARQMLEKCGEDTDAGILSAMLLGDRGILDGGIKELYADAGILHLLAISGLHVSFTGMALFTALRKIRVSFAGSAIVSGTLMAAYTCMTGWPVSAVRAVLMFCLFLLSQVTGRSADPATSLSVSAVAILLGNSGSLRQAGFLLSFGATGGILLAGTWKGSFLKGTSPGSCLAIQVATLPLTAYFYYQFPLYSILLNLCVLPLMPYILGSGIAGMAAAVCSPAAGRLFLAPAHWLLKGIELLCGEIRFLPCAQVVTGQPEPVKIAAYYITLLSAWIFCEKIEKRRKNRVNYAKIRKIDLIKLAIAIILLAGIFFDGDRDSFSITFLDVGQGDGCCIRNEDHSVWMIDGGSSSERNLAENCIEPFLKFNGRDCVDYWLISHYDMDHVSALLETLEEYERGAGGRNLSGLTVGTILLPEIREVPDMAQKILWLAKKNEIAVRFVGKGDTVKEENMTVRILSPEKEEEYENSNEASMVAEVRYGTFLALFTGDVEGHGEKRLLGGGLLRDVDVLKAAHHGSKNSTPDEFLKKVKPEVTVISCGEKNTYGHPHKELLQRLAENKSRTVRTDRQGAVEITVSEEGYSVRGYIEDAHVLSGREKL